MAKFTLTIEAETLDDLQAQLRVSGSLEADVEQPEAGATQDAEPGERKRPGRPKKSSDVSTAAGPASPSPSSASTDPFGDQIKESAAEPAGEVTLQMVRAALAAVVEKGASPPKLKEEVFAKVDAQSIGSTDPARYGELLKLLQDYQP